jgi:carbamoyl-phosphate synthase large subunit
MLLDGLGLKQPQSGTARSFAEAQQAASVIGYPVMVRPSYVLGGRAMEVVYDENSLHNYMTRAVKVSPKHPILIDKYLEDAIEVDVDAVSDGARTVIGGIMEHIEEAGVHSGDSACSLPPFSLKPPILDEIRRQTIALATELKVIGLMNVQYAVKDSQVYVLEVNPRGSRTVPFVSKTIGQPLAKIAMKVMIGRTLESLGFVTERSLKHVAIKEAVFPFNKFSGVDTILGPEMKSTGEVMGIDEEFGRAFSKSQAAAGNPLPLRGRVFISVKDKDKLPVVEIARRLITYGFTIEATRGTAEFLRQHQVQADTVNKVAEGRPHIVDHMKNREIQLMINTVGDKPSQLDSYAIRRTALTQNIPYFTTIAEARAVVRGIESGLKEGMRIKSVQSYHREIK